jgi:hypothetical protein
MDFVFERHLQGKRVPQRDADAYHRVYQYLALAWEYLGLQCKHAQGYRRIVGGKQACRVCGKVKGRADPFILLPSKGPKQIGRMARPTSVRVFANARAASVLDDTITFHGAKLKVDVHNRYKSKILGNRRDITMADERIVKLREGDIDCSIDDHLVHVKMPVARKREKGYGGFVWELKRDTLKRFPILVRYDDRGRLLGVEIFRPRPQGMRRQANR